MKLEKILKLTLIALFFKSVFFHVGIVSFLLAAVVGDCFRRKKTLKKKEEKNEK